MEVRASPRHELELPRQETDTSQEVRDGYNIGEAGRTPLIIETHVRVYCFFASIDSPHSAFAPNISSTPSDYHCWRQLKHRRLTLHRLDSTDDPIGDRAFDGFITLG